MDAIFYVMAILGCGDSGAQCDQVRVESVRYDSAAQCRAAMPDVLRRSTDLSYPVISAACRPGTPATIGARSSRARPPRG
ncbi:MAG: hypothetical protein ACOY45_13630 [Pseudomonadota bacterium]